MSFFESLYRGEKASKVTEDTIGRYMYPQALVVSDNQDPEKLGRVRAVSPANPNSQTAWLLQLANLTDSPTVPQVGSIVVVWFFDGKPEKGCYMPVNNRLVPHQAEDQTKDATLDIPRNLSVDIGDSMALDTGDRIDVNALQVEVVANGILLRTPKFESYLAITNTGITIYSVGQVIWSLQGGSLSIQDAAGFSINGQQVASVGAIDDEGDIIVTKGWS